MGLAGEQHTDRQVKKANGLKNDPRGLTGYKQGGLGNTKGVVYVI